MKKIKKILFVKAQKAFKRGTGVVLCSVLMLFASCVKQKNCDYGDTIVGKFVYLQKSYKSSSGGMYGMPYCPSNKTIVAHFIHNDGWESAITGYIPPKFKLQDTIRVRACLESNCHGFHTGDILSTYSLKCIERE